MKVVLVMFRDGRRRDFPLGQARTTIGRKTDCTLRVPAAEVSRRHCELSTLEKDVIVRDLGSANGTFVNGKRIAEKALKPGDTLTIGPVEFIVQIDGQPAKPEPAKVTVGSKLSASAKAVARPAKPDEKTAEKPKVTDELSLDDELNLDLLGDLELDDEPGKGGMPR